MTCAACGSTGCSHSDPVYAGIAPLPAVVSVSSGRFLAGGTHPRVTGGFVATPRHGRTLP